jgi:glutamate-ammonia-ligase adenylyltransferase
VLGRLDITEVGEALTDISTATLAGALTASTAAVEAERGQMPTRLSIILMGRLGGGEVGYGSDADVMFVHDPVEGADETEAASAAMAVAQGLRKMLAAPGDDPALEVDAQLRPEGRNGPLVRTIAAHRAYYEKWSAVWEAQALLRASATVGDPDLNARFTALIDPLRWPEGGATAAEVREIRRIKARVDSEWTVQLLQMQHAHAVPEMRTPRTLDALHGAVKADLVSHDDARTLEAAWRLVSRIRNAVVLLRAKPAESMVEQAGERAGVAHLLGYGMENGERMVDDYLRTTRQARKVVERIFYE